MCKWEVLVLDSLRCQHVPVWGRKKEGSRGGLHSRACATRTSEKDGKADVVGVKNADCFSYCLR